MKKITFPKRPISIMVLGMTICFLNTVIVMDIMPALSYENKTVSLVMDLIFLIGSLITATGVAKGWAEFFKPDEHVSPFKHSKSANVARKEVADSEKKKPL